MFGGLELAIQLYYQAEAIRLFVGCAVPAIGFNNC
jgi:hypothetical protein